MSASPPQTQLQLGTFLGVFTPTILTILGVIMYLRTGWLVGEAGLVGAWLIVIVANVITLLTTLSMSALATNMRVGAGGAYYLISRSLGLEVGGAIGIPLFVSQALSVTLYAYGLAASFELLWPMAAGEGAEFPLPIPLVAAAIVILVSVISAKSTELALKLQVPLMVIIFASIGSLLVGTDFSGVTVPSLGEFPSDGFWAVFAVFFPAVTGILAGVSLSGDLKDPAKAIPFGALSAVAVGFVIYLIIPFVLAQGADVEVLLDEERLIWMEISALPVVVVFGMWGAILSSALGSILGAPRTLVALADDGVLPERFGAVDPKTGEPTFALWASAGLALVACGLGALNPVAKVVTIFFLTTYAALNLVAGMEAWVGDPSFRPRIRAPFWASLLGAAGCLLAMFLISPTACVVALFIEGGIFWALSRRALKSTWGDVRSGAWFTLARFALTKLRSARHEPRNWRPHVLVFAADLEANLQKVHLANHLSQGRGIITVSTLLLGDIEDEADTGIVKRHNAVLDREGILAFCEVAHVESYEGGVITVAQANGMAGLESNTVLFGWPGEDPEAVGRMLGISRRLARLGKCTLIHRPCGPSVENTPGGDLVIWWKGLESNGDLMLLCANLLQRAPRRQGTRIVLRSIVPDRHQAEHTRRSFLQMLEAIRIEAEVDIILQPEDQSIAQVIHDNSQGAALVLMGFSMPEPGGETEYGQRLLELLDGLPTAMLVYNAGPFRGRLLNEA